MNREIPTGVEALALEVLEAAAAATGQDLSEAIEGLEVTIATSEEGGEGLAVVGVLLEVRDAALVDFRQLVAFRRQVRRVLSGYPAREEAPC